MKRKKVYVCAPYHGSDLADRERNEIRTGQICRNLYENGLHPVAPQLLYTRWLDEDDPKERADGLAAGLEWLGCCDALYAHSQSDEEATKND